MDSLISILAQGGLCGRHEALLATVLAALVGFYLLERAALWRHAHPDAEGHTHGAPTQGAAWVVLLGDGVHNFADAAAPVGTSNLLLPSAANAPLPLTRGRQFEAYEIDLGRRQRRQPGHAGRAAHGRAVHPVRLLKGEGHARNPGPRQAVRQHESARQGQPACRSGRNLLPALSGNATSLGVLAAGALAAWAAGVRKP